MNKNYIKGKVKFFNAKDNFGFIHGSDGVQYFVHTSGFPCPITEDIPRGVEVEFMPVLGDKGWFADGVNFVEEATEKSALLEEKIESLEKEITEIEKAQEEDDDEIEVADLNSKNGSMTGIG